MFLSETISDLYKQSFTTMTMMWPVISGFLFLLKAPELDISRCVVTSSVPIALAEVSTMTQSSNLMFLNPHAKQIQLAMIHPMMSGLEWFRW